MSERMEINRRIASRSHQKKTPVHTSTSNKNVGCSFLSDFHHESLFALSNVYENKKKIIINQYRSMREYLTSMLYNVWEETLLCSAF